MCTKVASPIPANYVIDLRKVYNLLSIPFLKSITSKCGIYCKTELRKQKDISQIPKHYEIGPRKLNIALTQLRCFASLLNYDLFQI